MTHHRRTATALDVDVRSAPTFPSSRARSTASRSSISTTPPRRRSRGRCIDAHQPLLRREQRQRPPRRALPDREGDRPHTRRRARRSRGFLGAAETAGDHLHAQRHRGHQPGRADLGPGATSSAGDEVLSRRWSTTRTSCRGRCCASETGATLRVDPDRRRRRAATGRVREAAHVADEAGRDGARCRTRSARSTRSPRSSALAHAAGAVVLVDGAQAASHMPSTSQRARLRLLSRSPATSCTGRPGSACSTARRRCSRRCRRGRAAAT